MNKTGFYIFMTYVLYKSVNLYKDQFLARKNTLVRNHSLVVFLSESEEVYICHISKGLIIIYALSFLNLFYPSLFVRILDGYGLRGCHYIYAKFIDSD